jgi:TolB-like protein
MKKVSIAFYAFLLSAVLLLCFAEAGAKRTLAILYFDNNSLAKKSELDPLRKGLADMLITEFSKIEQFQVVERSQLQQIIEEMKLGQSGMIDGSTAQQVGKLLGAQNLFLGSYMNMFDGQMRIDIRIVEVETGLTLKAEEETGNPKELYKLITRLVGKTIKDLDIKLSKSDVQRLSQVENTSFDSALYYAKGLEFEDAGDLTNAKKMYQQALKKNGKFVKAEERLTALSKK